MAELTKADIIAAIRTLDQAVGDDDGYFRWRLRMYLHVEETRELRQRLVALALPQHGGTCDCSECDAAYGPRRRK